MFYRVRCDHSKDESCSITKQWLSRVSDDYHDVDVQLESSFEGKNKMLLNAADVLPLVLKLGDGVA